VKEGRNFCEVESSQGRLKLNPFVKFCGYKFIESRVSLDLLQGWVAYDGYVYSTGLYTGPTFTSLSPGKGYDYFDYSNLAAGTYTIKVTAPGYETKIARVSLVNGMYYGNDIWLAPLSGDDSPYRVVLAWNDIGAITVTWTCTFGCLPGLTRTTSTT
jgi:hypothetical protein